MAFTVSVSEVGPAEFPLMQVLRDTVFGEFGHVSTMTVEQRLAPQTDLLMLMAHLEGNPVGFSAGCRREGHTYYVNFMAILRDYRGQGIGKEFMSRQESFARSRGYTRIQFNTQNRFPGMIRLGLTLGYRPIGLEQHDGTMNDLVFRFGKSFNNPHPPQQSVMDAIARGEQIAGLVRDDATGRLQILFSEARR